MKRGQSETKAGLIDDDSSMGTSCDINTDLGVVYSYISTSSSHDTIAWTKQH